MREYPVFVPFGGDRLAAVVAVPDGDPRGLVLLLTGGSATRSHRFQVWTRAARRLAEEHGIASVRFDYRGVGDSTGELRQWRMAEIPVDQALAVLAFVRRAVGSLPVGVTGNCLGARVALAVAAAAPECVAAALIRSPVLAPSAVGKVAEKAARTPLARLVRSSTPLRRMSRALFGRKRKSARPVRASLGRALGHAHLLFLYSEEDFTFGDRVERDLRAVVDRLPGRHRERFRLRVLTGGHLKGFESIEAQDRILDEVVAWFGDRLRATVGPTPSRS